MPLASTDPAVCPRGGQDCPPVELCGSRAVLRSLVVIKPAGSRAKMELSWQEGWGSPQQSPFLTWLLPCTNLHVPILSFSYLSIPYHRWGNRGTEMQGLAWGLVAIEEPGCVEERPVAASLAGSLPPDALALREQPGLYLGLPCFPLEPTTMPGV